MEKQEQKQSVAVITDNAAIGVGLEAILGERYEIYALPRKVLHYKTIHRRYDLILVMLEMDVWEEAMQFTHMQAKHSNKVIIWDVQHHSVRECMALQLGASDYLLQSTDPARLRERIAQCLAGLSMGAIRLSSLLLQGNIPRLPRVTEAQVTFLEMLHVNPFTPNEAIAQNIFRSTGRVKNILTDVYLRFGVSDRYQLVAKMQALHYFQGCMPLLKLVEGVSMSAPLALPRRTVRLTPRLQHLPPLLRLAENDAQTS